MIKLITVGDYHINPDQVTHVEPGAHAVRIFVTGRDTPITVRISLQEVLTLLQGKEGID